MQNEQKRYVTLVIGFMVLGALAAGGWYWWQGSNNVSSVDTSTGAIATLDLSAATPPSLDRQLNFSAEFPADAKEIIVGNTQKLRDVLTANPGDFAAWLDLAIQYKTIGDYKGAEEVWRFLNLAAPNQSISFQNLGDLYAHYLKNYPAAEESYRQAITNAPTQINPYAGLAELYHYLYKAGQSTAEAVLQEGIAALGDPASVDLKLVLARYYNEDGKKEAAREYFLKARDDAKELGNSQLVQTIDAQLSALK